MPEKITQKIRREVEERARGCCEYCMAQQKYSHDYFVLEHIYPIIKGGRSRKDNLAFSCQACNNHKYVFTEAIDPVSGKLVSLFHPRKHQWKDHFTWNESCGQMIGITSIGRATVERLCLNREHLVTLRLALAEVKKHPPAQSV